MTREAKIGMLTGLGVIVAIGVLLSEYLGDRNTGPTAIPMATGKMANLPVGPDYRQQVLTPVGVPAMTPAGGGERTPLAGGGELAAPVSTGNNGMPPTMYAVDPSVPTGPSAEGPVMPIAAGPTLMDVDNAGGPPTLTLRDITVPAKLNNPGAAKPAGVTYIIQPGDTLAKIAKKFYNSSKSTDVARIVAANPGVLKDASTMLVARKPIMIPNLPVAAGTAGAAGAPASGAAAVQPVRRPLDPGLVRMPGGAAGDVQVPLPGVGGVVLPPKKDAPGVVAATIPAVPKVDTTKTATYVVQAGDSLEKIARRIAPGKVTETVAKLTSLNGIKDPSKLKAGQTLKVPA